MSDTSPHILMLNNFVGLPSAKWRESAGQANWVTFRAIFWSCLATGLKLGPASC